MQAGGQKSVEGDVKNPSRGKYGRKAGGWKGAGKSRGQACTHTLLSHHHASRCQVRVHQGASWDRFGCPSVAEYNAMPEPQVVARCRPLSSTEISDKRACIAVVQPPNSIKV